MIYVYKLYDDTYGVVEANIESEARLKVKEAYEKHGRYESEITNDMIEIESIYCGHVFMDCSDVIEVCTVK